MAFIKARKKMRVSSALGEAVTITSRGKIHCFDILCGHFEGMTHANLYFDPDQELIGIEPVMKADRDSYKILKPKTGTGLDIFAKGFFQQFGIDISETRVYLAKWDEDEGKLVFATTDVEPPYEASKEIVFETTKPKKQKRRSNEK